MQLIQIGKSFESRSPICTQCEGACCKACPGSTHPLQWGKTHKERVKNLIAALKTGKWAIDCWEGEYKRTGVISPNYVRPAIKGKEGQLTDWSWGGECTFLGDSGCTLPYENRPIICRTLKADITMQNCGSAGPWQDKVAGWHRFQRDIEVVLETLGESQKEEED